MNKSFQHNWDIIWSSSVAELKVDARKGKLGVLWWVLEPVLYMTVFYLVFVVIMKRTGEEHVAFLLVGLVIWRWFGSTVPKVGNCLRSNIGLLKQVYISKITLILSEVGGKSLQFVIIFFTLICFLLWSGKSPGVMWLFIPILLMIQLLLIVAVGSILATLTAYLPDINILVPNIFQLLFFLSGIFFDLEAVDPAYRRLLLLNPMAGIIHSFRLVLIHNQAPQWEYLGVVSLIA